MNRPLISIITPTYNSARFIGETIDSVCAQKYPHWEMIIADDGSEDETVAIAQKRALNESRISIHAFPHGGLPAISRNRALRLAQGEFIAFLDADDIWESHKLEVQLASLDIHKAKWGFTNARLFGHVSHLYYGERWRPGKPFFLELLMSHGVHCASIVVCRELIEQISKDGDIGKAFDESKELKAVEDWDFTLRLSQISEPEYVPKVLSRYRIHEAGISQDSEKSYLRNMAILRKYQRLGVSERTLRKARNLHLSKLAISRMINDNGPWRSDIFTSCLSLPVSLRNYYLAFLAILPKKIAKKLYLWTLFKVKVHPSN